MKSFFQALLLAIFVSFFPAVSSAKACLTAHIQDAIQLNKKRAVVYSQLTNGQSEAVSKRLIRMETWLMFAVPFADGWAMPYQKAGVNILCDDFIDMSETPAFKAMNPNGKDNIANFKAVDVQPIIQDLDYLLDNNFYSHLAKYADEQIQEMDKNPRYNCMVKHVLESIRRMAILAPRHNALAKKTIKIPSITLSKIVLRNHINMLDTSSEIDVLAAPMQADGIQIVCQDVPYIPAP